MCCSVGDIPPDVDMNTIVIVDSRKLSAKYKAPLSGSSKDTKKTSASPEAAKSTARLASVNDATYRTSLQYAVSSRANAAQERMSSSTITAANGLSAFSRVSMTTTYPVIDTAAPSIA